MAKKWTEKDIPDLNGKVIIITGANNGLGFENTLQFARKKATVIMACRHIEKGQKAFERVKKKIPNAKIELIKLDLASLDSVRHFCKEFKEKYSTLDVLLNNAGIMMVPYRKTVDGFESQIGTNHLGHFALTAHLFELLRTTPGSRIVNVSSSLHESGEMYWDDFLFEKKYNRTEAYARSKLANLLFTYELDRRLKAKGINVLAVASHPGFANTGLANHLFGPAKYILKPVVFRIVAQSARKGALPSTRAAVDPSVQGGEYFGPKGIFGNESRGFPKIVQSNEKSHNLEDAKKLWEVSEELTGIKFEI